MELGEGKRALGGSQISPLFRLPPHSPGDTPGPSAPCHHPRPPSLGVPLPPIPLLTGQDPSLEPDRAAPSTVDQKLQKKTHFRPRFPPACCPQAVPRCQLPLPPALPRATGMLRGGPGGAPQPSPGAEQSRNPSAPQPLPRPSLCHRHKVPFVPQSRPPPSPPPALTSMPSAPGTPGGPGGPRGPGSPGGPRYGEKGGGEGSGRRRRTPGDYLGSGAAWGEGFATSLHRGRFSGGKSEHPVAPPGHVGASLCPPKRHRWRHLGNGEIPPKRGFRCPKPGVKRGR